MGCETHKEAKIHFYTIQMFLKLWCSFSDSCSAWRSLWPLAHFLLSSFPWSRVCFCLFKVSKVCVSCSVVSDSLQPHGLYSLPGSFVHGILQARILAWIVMPFSRRSSRHRDQIPISLRGRFFTTSATWEALSDWLGSCVQFYSLCGNFLDESITLGVQNYESYISVM